MKISKTEMILLDLYLQDKVTAVPLCDTQKAHIEINLSDELSSIINLYRIGAIYFNPNENYV